MSQFCLKWDNYVDNMMTVFKELLSTEAMVDCTLACDGLSLKAHKLILSAFSPFFQSLFLENPCQHPIVILKDMKYAELKSIVEFMYHGEITVTQEQLSALMKIARTLKVKGLGEVMFENNQSSDESENHSGDDEAGDMSGDEPGNHSDDNEPSLRSTPKRRRGRTRRRLTSNHSDSDKAFHPEMEHSGDDMDALPDDVDHSSTPFSTDPTLPLQYLSTSPLENYQEEQKDEQEEVAKDDVTSEDKLDLETSKSLEQTLATDDELPRRSSRSSAQSNIERHSQSGADQSCSNSLVTSSPSPRATALATDNQQPESSPASPSKKLQKKAESKKVLKKSLPRKSSPRKPEVKDPLGSYPRKVLDDFENLRKNTREIEKYAVVDENATPVHPKNHRKSHKCQSCKFKTASARSLRRHISTVHEKNKKYSCEKCDYKAALSQSLQRHIAAVHEKKRLFRCKLCDYESSQECNLMRHTKTVHERLKPFKCQACDYRASQKMGVIKHYNDIHLKIKFFSCAFCKYQTSRKENLVRHLKMHGLKKKKL